MPRQPKYVVSCTKSILLPLDTTEMLFILLLKNRHTDLRTLTVKECAARYLSLINSNCCKPVDAKLTIQRTKWFIRLPPSEPPIVDLIKISLKPSIYTLKSCEDKTPP